MVIHIFEKNKKYDFITYPVFLDELISNKYNKHIYLFGDRHVTDIKCPHYASKMKVTDLLTFLSSLPDLKDKDKNPLLIDYYFELPYKNKLKENFYKKQSVYSVDALSNINKTFFNCLQVNKESCKYKNVRMHYSDIRSDDTHFGDLAKIQLFIGLISFLVYKILSGDVSDPYKNFDYWRVNIDEVKTFPKDRPIKYFSNINMFDINWNKLLFFKNNNTIDELVDYYLKVSKVYKQLENIEFPQIYQDIKNELIHHYIKKWISIIFDNLDFLRNIIDKTPLELNKDNDKIFNIQQSMLKNDKIMDVYLLSRLFKKHQNAPSSQNIIIYVGLNHANFYKDFFQRHGFKSIRSTSSIDNNRDHQCINISNFKQPFFNKIFQEEPLNDFYILNFCKNPNQENFNLLNNYVKRLFKNYSDLCLKYKKGNLKLASIIIDLKY